jgi:4-oxalocrotonate tautomerase
MIKGRPAERRKAFSKAVTDVAVETLGVPIESVRVIITEIEPENWSVAGKSKDEN